jgi:hypothetical protein
MPNEATKTLPNSSLLQKLLAAAAPGGALTRRPIFLGLAVGLVLLIAGVGMLAEMRRRADDPAALRLGDGEISRLSTRSYVTNASFARSETREYGLLDDRKMDASITMTVPQDGRSGMRDFYQEIRELDAVRRSTRTSIAGAYELQTRFGLYQAADIQIDIGGRWKDCLMFMSRFETNTVYVKGWYCDGVGVKPSAERLACALDGMTIDSPLATAGADSFMREHVARPSFCAAIGSTRDREPRPLLPAFSNHLR